MNTREKLVLLKNSAANVVRGGASAIVAVALPPFLARMMSPDSYGAWSLVLQLSAFVGYLDFGIQTAVGRFVAHANESRDTDYRDRIVSTATIALLVAGSIAILAAVAVAFLFPYFFAQMPHALVGDTRIAFLLVAFSLAIGLPASVCNGIFVGLQRYEIPAAIIGGSRFISALLIVLVVKRGGSLAAIGATVAIVNLASYLFQYLICRRAAQGYRVSRHLASRAAGRELLDYCFSLSIWSFAMLLITGLDLALVGHFQFDAVVYYAVAASLVTFLSGLQNAIFTTMVPSTAVMQARGDKERLGRLMITATRYGTFILLLTGLPLVFLGKWILTVWVGSSYAENGVTLLRILVIANVIRLSATPYVMTLVGTGQQRLVILTPLLEGFSNLATSVVCGSLFGAIGVAAGTLVGALFGTGGNLFYNMKRTKVFEFRISDYVRDGLLRPVVCALPAVSLAALLYWTSSMSRVAYAVAVVFAILATAYLIWNWGLVGSERERILTGRLVPQA